jgi:lipid-A-disaccharide synthase
MKYYIVAGEASGDLHASNLIKAIRGKDPDADFRGWGGDLMEAEGCDLVKHYRDLAFMGFWEVFKNLTTVLRNINICKVDIMLYEPDVLILIDYPGFNLRIAEFAKEQNIRVVYYIAPQVWAWKKGRVKKIKANVDDLLVILPFEEAFYAKYDYQVHFVGNPLLDAMAQFDGQSDTVRNFRQYHSLDERPIVAILPGSRKQEITTMLPIMLQITNDFPEYQFVISTVNWQPYSLYRNILKDRQIKMVEGETYPLLLNAKAAIVASGTASLETALLNTPQVVCYKGSWLSYFIAKQLVKGINYISLANLILNKQIFSELIQGEVSRKRIGKELRAILNDEKTIEAMKSDYETLRRKLGNGGASEKAAEIICQKKV